MSKKTSNSSKKEMSEGKTIIIAVLLLGAGFTVFIYVLQLLFGYFFPNF